MNQVFEYLKQLILKRQKYVGALVFEKPKILRTPSIFIYERAEKVLH